MGLTVVLNPDMRGYLPLMRQSWAELIFPSACRPDFELYSRMMEDGLYFFYGALFDGDPVGYIGVMRTNSLFNGDPELVLDSFFVREEYRNGIVPAKLLNAVMDGHAGRRMLFGCPANSPLAKTLQKRGWKQREVIYVKEAEED